jgi:hypothetical protein
MDGDEADEPYPSSLIYLFYFPIDDTNQRVHAYQQYNVYDDRKYDLTIHYR